MTQLKYTFVLLILILTGCTQQFDYGYGDFRLDFATIAGSGTSRYLLLDNQTVLQPKSVIGSNLTTGSRVLINYSLSDKIANKSYNINLNSIGQINSSVIKSLTANYPNDPVLIESIWQSGDWLNFRLSFEYFEKQHSMELFQQPNSKNDTIYLELRHSKNGDSAGFWVKTYCSYAIKSFAKTGKSVPLKLKVNTAIKGTEYFFFDYIN